MNPMSEIVEDYLDAEGVRYTRSERQEHWGQLTSVFTVPLNASKSVSIFTGDHPPEIRIVVQNGERTRVESYVSVTAGTAALIQSIVRAAIAQY